MNIRPEHPNDIAEIKALIWAAFKPVTYSDDTEADIVDMLRDDAALTLSLVAEKDGEILGHIAFSPVTIAGKPSAWLGLGPLAVLPKHQNIGIGSALVKAGLSQIKQQTQGRAAKGCVVLGNPNYYGRFGFQNDPALQFTGAPAKNFLALHFTDKQQSTVPTTDEVIYHKAFGSPPI